MRTAPLLRTARTRNRIATVAIICSALMVVPGIAQKPRPASTRNDPPLADTSIPTEAEQRALIDRVIADQHANDLALPLFQRIEHRQVRGRDGDASAVDDRTSRIIPTGVNSGRIILAEHGNSSDPATIHEQMAIVARALEAAQDPANKQTKLDREKYEKRMHDRAEFVSTVRNAYTFTWEGREVRGGRTLAKFKLDPNPSFVPKTREEDLLRHATAVAWVDEKSAQLVRMEADLNSEIAFAWGIAGKISRGARLIYEQAEAEPGLWFPTLYQYDLTGRKFFFYFELHQHTETSHYVRAGTASQALASLRAEISGGASLRPIQ